MANIAIASLIASGVRHTYAVRREIVHFKKACLHLMQRAVRLERGLVRHTQFFYREVHRCSEGGLGHDCADCREWRTRRQHELHFCRAARRPRCTSDTGAGAGEGDLPPPTSERPSTVARDDYLDVCETLHCLRGLRVALQDARTQLKTLCLLPRHVTSDDEIAPSLLDMRSGFTATGLVERALSDAATCGGEAPTRSSPSEDGAGPARIGLSADVMTRALATPLAQLPPALPSYVRRYIRQSLFARGLPKAAAQKEGAALLARVLRALQGRSAHALAALEAALARADPSERATAEASRGGGVVGVVEADTELIAALRTEMRLGRHARLLGGLHAANAALLATLEATVGERGDAPATAFVAGDAGRGAQTMWYPPTFAPLLAQLRTCEAAHDAYEHRMRARMHAEGWPPPPAVRRTRVHEGGPLPCRVCERRFSRLWQERGVCWQCEQRLRELGRCPFGAATACAPKRHGRGGAKKLDTLRADARTDHPVAGAVGSGVTMEKATEKATEKAMAGLAAAHPFCPHHQRCAACDSTFVSCGACRLAQGDGEVVLAAIKDWKPSVLFLDFDLTLCTTRGGANPLAGAHTVDTELHAAATLLRNRTHVVTRNRHTREIGTFLEERGVPVVNVHTTASGVPKTAYIQATLVEGERAVFVDDSAGEVGEAGVRNDPRIFRVLFVR